MAFGPAVDRGRLLFDEGQLEHGADTGRGVYEQLAAARLDVRLLRPATAFAGRWGTLYLDGAVYHHGSGSFRDADDPRLQAQAAHRRSEHDFFRRRVFAGRYDLSRPEAWVADLLAAQPRVRRRLARLRGGA
jgi:hypothetical protein